MLSASRGRWVNTTFNLFSLVRQLEQGLTYPIAWWIRTNKTTSLASGFWLSFLLNHRNLDEITHHSGSQESENFIECWYFQYMLNCLLKSLFRLITQQTLKLYITGPLWGETTMLLMLLTIYEGNPLPKGECGNDLHCMTFSVKTTWERGRNQQGINDVNFQQMPTQCHWLLILKANQPRTHAGQIANYKLILDMQAFYKTSS